MYYYRGSERFGEYVKKRGGIFRCNICGKWHYHDSKIGKEHWRMMQEEEVE